MVDKTAETQIRLQKVLANAGLGSRRACEVLIEEGRVEVDGKRIASGKPSRIPTKMARISDRLQVNRKWMTLRRLA